MNPRSSDALPRQKWRCEALRRCCDYWPLKRPHRGAIVRGMSVPMSARQAAAWCGVSEKTIRRWIRSGRLAADKAAGEFQVDHDQLAAVCGQRRGQAADNGQGADIPAASNTEASGLADTGAADIAAVDELARLVREQAQTIMELAGRVGYLQAELSQAREQLALMAPRAEAESSMPIQEVEPESLSALKEVPPLPWWHPWRWFGG